MMIDLVSANSSFWDYALSLLYIYVAARFAGWGFFKGKQDAEKQ